jgi:hypothetical protein
VSSPKIRALPDFYRFLYLLPMIYFVFLAWDVTKYYEYRDVKTAVTKRDRKRRIQITIDYLVIFLVMAFLYQLLSNPMFEWKARLNGGI